MEAVLHEAEEALKSEFEAKLNQELKILRERHYFLQTTRARERVRKMKDGEKKGNRHELTKFRVV
jgi:hypothetical protein